MASSSDGVKRPPVRPPINFDAALDDLLKRWHVSEEELLAHVVPHISERHIFWLPAYEEEIRKYARWRSLHDDGA